MLCKNCGTELASSAKFCTNCGTPTGLGSISNVNSSLGNGRLNQFSNTRNKQYALPAERFEEIFGKLCEWLELQNFELQQLPVDEDTVLIQIRSKGGWKKLVGMSTALSINLDYSNGQLSVSIGEGKWMDKIAAAGVAWFVLWPLAVTSSVGIYSQMKYPEKIFDFIEAIL